MRKLVGCVKIGTNILAAIGNTSLVELQQVVPQGYARVLVKLEWENPTGSMKDRMAQAMIDKAEQDGRLKPGGTVVEYTGGSTGTSLAFICAAKGYRLRIISSDAFSRDKLDHMQALGAEVTVIPSHGRGITKELIDAMIEKARKISETPETYWTNQLHNQDQISGYFALGEEIWEQTEGKVDAYVQVVGTAGSLTGTAIVLKKHNPDVKIVAVEPKESPVLSGGSRGAHGIDGIGIGFIPPLWNSSLIGEIIQVSTQEAKVMAQRLAREEGLFAGTSSGANVVAAIRIAKTLGPKATVVTLLNDSGLKYLSTDLYKTS